MSLELINTPILAMIQDKGRYGYSHIGVSISGAMDEYAYMMANKLLENKLDENTIEIAFSNVELKVHVDTVISITGAYCEFFINNEAKNIWQTYNVRAGDIIKIGRILSGVRVYLCVKNGFNLKKEFGSFSTSLKEKLGGLSGDKLKKGDVLTYSEFKPNNSNTRLKDIYREKFEGELELRVVLGYQESYFKKEEKDKFFSKEFTLSNDSNRMGCKLQGESINCDIDGIISEGICFGAIQIPKDGQPIILLKDRQTIGGYPKIGSVLSIDCFKLAQAKPNSKIRFKEIDICDAQVKLKEFYNQF